MRTLKRGGKTDNAVSDVYPPSVQRPALLALVKALGCRDSALRRDACGDWRIEGRFGHIYAAPGSLDRRDTPGFQIYIAGSARWWTSAKPRSRSERSPTTAMDEGMHFVFRLPATDEAQIIRHYVGLAKKREISVEERARLSSIGNRFGFGSDSADAQSLSPPLQALRHENAALRLHGGSPEGWQDRWMRIVPCSRGGLVVCRAANYNHPRDQDYRWRRAPPLCCLSCGVVVAIVSYNTRWDWWLHNDIVEKVADRFDLSYSKDAALPVQRGDPEWAPLLRLIEQYSPRRVNFPRTGRP